MTPVVFFSSLAHIEMRVMSEVGYTFQCIHPPAERTSKRHHLLLSCRPYPQAKGGGWFMRDTLLPLPVPLLFKPMIPD